MGVGQGATGKDGRADEESGAVADVGVFGSDEHNVADHDERAAGNNNNLAAVEPAADGGHKQGKEGANDIGRDGQELLLDDALVRVDGGDDGGGEERETLDGDVVKEESPAREEDDGVEDAGFELLGVHLVDDLGLADTLGLDTRNGEVTLLLGEPFGGCGVVGEGKEADEGQANGNDALNTKDHSPTVKAAEVVELENARRQEATKGAGERRHDNVER